MTSVWCESHRKQPSPSAPRTLARRRSPARVNVKPVADRQPAPAVRGYARCAREAADVPRRHGRAGRGRGQIELLAALFHADAPKMWCRAPTTRTTRRPACSPTRWRRARGDRLPLGGVDAPLCAPERVGGSSEMKLLIRVAARFRGTAIARRACAHWSRFSREAALSPPRRTAAIPPKRVVSKVSEIPRRSRKQD
jgi:hypothetical protein